MYKKKKHKRPFFSISFRVILIIFASALLICYLSVFINPAVFWFPSFFGLYFLPLAFINFLLLIIGLIRRSQSSWIPFLILLPTLFYAEYFVKFNREEVPVRSNEVRLLTYNVGRFISGKEKIRRENNTEKIADFINEQRPDIVSLQEFCINDTSKIEKLFYKYPYRQSHLFKLRDNTYFGNIILSKYPIVSGGKITFKGSTNLAIYSDIEYNRKRIRIYNCHLESNNISLTSLVKKLGGKSNYDEISYQVKEAHEKMKGSFSKRSKQVDIVLKHIKSSDYLSIVCGDFNDTPISYTLYKLRQGRKDTFKEGGKGFSSTYSVLWPALRIDYILVPESFEVIEHLTEKVRFSDHYPVITRFYCDHDIDTDKP